MIAGHSIGKDICSIDKYCKEQWLYKLKQATPQAILYLLLWTAGFAHWEDYQEIES